MKKNNLIINGVVSNLFFKLPHRMNFYSENTIVIFGSIRSDPIWLAEILSTLNGHLQIFERLQPIHVPQVKQYVPHWNQYIPAGIGWPAGRTTYQISRLRAYSSC